MDTTTIKVHEDTKTQLDKFREYKNESYDEVIRKVLYIAKTTRSQPALSRQAVEAIEKARKRIRAGKLITEAEAKRRLGL